MSEGEEMLCVGERFYYASASGFIVRFKMVRLYPQDWISNVWPVSLSGFGILSL